MIVEKLLKKENLHVSTTLECSYEHFDSVFLLVNSSKGQYISTHDRDSLSNSGLTHSLSSAGANKQTCISQSHDICALYVSGGIP